MPQYVIEPPDILTIKAVQVVARSPYRIRVLDVLAIQATDSVPTRRYREIFRSKSVGSLTWVPSTAP